MRCPIRNPGDLSAALRTLFVSLATLSVAPACDSVDRIPTAPHVAIPVAPQPVILGADVVVLSPFGGTTLNAEAINDAGQVVGTSSLVGTAATHAFLWTPGQAMQNLGTLGGGFSFAVDINAAGQVVGRSVTAASASHAFLWTPGQGMQDLGTMGGGASSAEAINDAGQVVGFSFIAGNSEQHAFLWTPGQGFQDLGTLGGTSSYALDINESGWVVGQSTNSANIGRAFLWRPGQGMQDLGTLGGLTSFASGVNNAGQVVGWTTTAGNLDRRAFLWTPGIGMQDLGTLGGTSTVAQGINDAGQVVGHSAPGELPITHGFLWTAADGMEDLYPATGITWATAINNRGQVVGGNRVATLRFQVPNRAPVPNAGGPYTGHKKVSVEFDGTGSTDPDGDVLTYAWDFGDGSPLGSGPAPVHEYTAWGTYTASLTVSDPAGLSAVATTTVTIAPPGHLRNPR
jgi:probable HAF family extracellular repeat protein